jgi:uncharacterized protein (DUF1697 family)
MAVFVCLLRAIGPATHALMSMADLRAGCEAAGLTDVATHGNTGNLICRSTRSPRAVRGLVQQVVEGFGLPPACEVFVRTPRQMAFVVDTNPFPEAVIERPQHVGVCSFHNAPRWPAWVKDYEGPHRLATIGAHLIVDYPDGNASGLDIERRIGARMTQRNWRVFASLAEKAAALQSWN